MEHREHKGSQRAQRQTIDELVFLCVLSVSLRSLCSIILGGELTRCLCRLSGLKRFFIDLHQLWLAGTETVENLVF